MSQASNQYHKPSVLWKRVEQYMARTQMIYGVITPLTQEEETARDAEELAWANAKPMNDWKSSMRRTDNGMPRYLEDIFNRDGTDGLPQVLIDKYNTKKDLRATKP